MNFLISCIKKIQKTSVSEKLYLIEQTFKILVYWKNSINGTKKH